MNVEALMTEVYGIQPLKVEPMSFGHTNQVYSVHFRTSKSFSEPIASPTS
ncbi:hypothetical protein [Paenibacillus lautus]|nr:hypothetical protein [Paenibacillus lautus]